MHATHVSAVPHAGPKPAIHRIVDLGEETFHRLVPRKSELSGKVEGAAAGAGRGGDAVCPGVFVAGGVWVILSIVASSSFGGPAAGSAAPAPGSRGRGDY